MSELMLLPQMSGLGYYSYSPINQQYGTEKTVDTIKSVASLMKLFNNTIIGIGDMSFSTGQKMSPHTSHRNGKNVDIRPIRTDGLQGPISIKDEKYDREMTKRLVNMLRANKNVKKILFNDSSIPGVQHWVGHDNHLHVIMKD